MTTAQNLGVGTWLSSFLCGIAISGVPKKVQLMLEEVLTFLSNDRWFFNFVPLQKDRPEQRYLQLSESRDWPFYAPERVLMFSGGLDSLAGAVETAKAGGNVVLVCQRPAAN